MKGKYLFLVLFLCSLVISSQAKSGSVLFDFTKPQSLIPAVTPAEGNGSEIVVSGFTAYDGVNAVKLTRSYGTSAIKTSIKDDVKSYYLNVTSRSILQIEGLGNVKIDSIKSTGNMNSLYLLDGYKGYMDPYQYGRQWVNNSGTDVDSLAFKVGTSDISIQTMTVYYSTLSSYIYPSSVYVDGNNAPSGSTLESFKNITLSFDEDIANVNDADLKVYYNGVAQTSTASYDGGILSLSLADDLSENGTVSISIPSGSITYTSGNNNGALSYTFTIQKKEEEKTFSPTSYLYENETIDTLFDGFTVTFPDVVGYVVEKNITILDASGDPVCVVKPQLADNDNKQIKFVYQNNYKALTTEGTYKLTVPAKTVCNTFYGTEYELWNAEFVLTYTIGKGSTPDPTPDPDPDPDPTPDPTPTISDEVKALLNEANLALAKNGVGYPTTESSSYTSLKELVDTANANTTVAELSAALDSLYKETNIMKPVIGNYYSLSAVNSNGEQLYVAYKDGAIVLSSSANDAVKFVAVSTTDGKTTFKTIDDGKYLHVLSVSSNIYPSTTTDNVTSAYSSIVNDLTFNKLNIETVDAQKTFGLVSMFGGLGETATGKEGAAYALIDFSKSSIATIPDDNTLMFSDTYSSAFKITDVDKEDITITLSPTVSVSSDYTTLTVSFANSGVTSVSVNASSDEKPYIVSGTTTKDVTLVDAGNNTFTVSLGNLNNGTYTLVIPKGLLICSKDGIEFTTEEMSESFSISNSKNDYDASLYFGFGPDTDINLYYDDTILNKFYVSASNTIIPDPNKTVKIVNYYTGNPVRVGVLITKPDTQNSDTLVLKFIDGVDNYGEALSTDTIVSGELKAGTYKFVVEMATFGDINFGRKLNGESLNNSDCKVNQSFTMSVNIDTSKTSRIDSVETVNTSEANIIYDLTGRRLQSMEKPGLYIVNGKKVVKR